MTEKKCEELIIEALQWGGIQITPMTADHCSSDLLMKNRFEVGTLRDRALQAIHKKLSYRITLSDSETYISYLNVPIVLEGMKLPKSIKDDLISMYKSCNVHRNLTCVVHGHTRRTLFTIKDNSFLFKKVKESNFKDEIYFKHTLTSLLKIINRLALHLHIINHTEGLFDFLQINCEELHVDDLF